MPKQTVAIEVYEKVSHETGERALVTWVVDESALEQSGLSNDEFAAAAFQLVSLTNDTMAEALHMGDFTRSPIEPGPRLARLMKVCQEVIEEGLTVQERPVQ